MAGGSDQQQPEKGGRGLSRKPESRRCWRGEVKGLKKEVGKLGLRAEEWLEPLGVWSLVGKGDQEMLWGGPQRRCRSLTQAPEP